MKRNRHSILATSLAATILVGATGCQVSVPPPVPASTDVDYTPLYYDDYVVYYDDDGRPIYYVDGVVFVIPPVYRDYPRYVEHYHRYGPSYRRWHSAHGHRVERRPPPPHGAHHPDGPHDPHGPHDPGGPHGPP